MGPDVERPKLLLCTKRSHDQLTHCQLLLTPWSGLLEALQLWHIMGIVYVAHIQSRSTSKFLALDHED